MEIRTGTKEDITEISKVHALSWKAAYKGLIPQAYLDELKEDFWVFALEKWITEKNVHIKVAVEKNQIVGCGIYGKSRDEEVAEWGEVVSLYLLPEYFGKGLGEMLFHSMLEDLKKLNFEVVYLWVLEKNHRARAFYEKNEFSRDEKMLEFEIMKQSFTDVRYIRKLKD